MCVVGICEVCDVCTYVKCVMCVVGISERHRAGQQCTSGGGAQEEARSV